MNATLFSAGGVAVAGHGRTSRSRPVGPFEENPLIAVPHRGGVRGARGQPAVGGRWGGGELISEGLATLERAGRKTATLIRPSGAQGEFDRGPERQT